jgi:lipoyl(octanoyl) transferase
MKVAGGPRAASNAGAAEAAVDVRAVRRRAAAAGSPTSEGVTALRNLTPALDVDWLGTVAYDAAVELQRELVEARRAGRIRDRLLLLEHPHVITLGASAREEHVLMDVAERALLGIEVHESGRGGDVTYHGPGQLVGYPILDLKPDRKDLHRYVRDIEQALIGALAALGVAAGRSTGRTGVWVGNDKIAAIGVRVSSGWITSHGFALNVDTDLRFFESIVPCGIRDGGVTSIARHAPGEIPMDAVRAAVATQFAHTFGLMARNPGARPARARAK